MITNQLKKQFIEFIFGRRNYTPPSNFYFGVSSTDIAPNGTGATEPPASAGYTRITIPNTELSWSTANIDNVVNNLKQITLNEITTTCDTVTNFFLSDSINGLPLVYEKLKPVDYRPMPKNSTLYINVGGATFSMADINT